MTNPNNAIGTPSGYGGRTSVLAYNSLAQGYARGVLSGFDATIDQANMVVNLGGSSVVKDIAIAQNSYGEKAIVLNTTSSAVSVSLPNPSATTQWASIVAYISSNAPTTSAVLDNTSACGIIAVVGTGSAFPTEAQIRTAIASDGGDSLLSPYVVLARASYTSGSTTINTSAQLKSRSLVRPAIETARSNSNITVAVSPSSYTEVPLIHLAGDNDVFKVQSNKIVIPAGITRVKLNASFNHWIAASSGTFNTFSRITMTRNGATTEIQSQPWQFEGDSSQIRHPITTPPIVASVQEGDLLGLDIMVYSGPSSTALVNHGGTYLTVEEC